MRKRVYKFISAENGISNLNNKRLKVSTIADLNDPCDLCPVDTTDPAISKAMDALTSYMWDKRGILCFSRNWDNLLMWSHYGASHTGVCLGFDIPQREPGPNYDTDVLYQPSLLKIADLRDVNSDLTDRLPRTKHEVWSYEQEVRMFVDLTDQQDADKRHCFEFGPSLVLKEVIIGAQCSPDQCTKVEEAVKHHDNDVMCWWAGMRQDAFLLVKQHLPPPWQSTIG